MCVRKNQFVVTVIGIVFLIFVQLQIFSASSTVSGKVTDIETGSGIKGVCVDIYTSGLVIGDRMVVTDENGAFIFPQVEPGKIRLKFRPPPPYSLHLGKGGYDIFVLEVGKNLYLEKKLDYGGTIVGRVYEKNTKELLEIDFVRLEKQLPLTVKVKNGGEYQIDQIKPGNYVLLLNLKDYAAKRVENVIVKAKETIRLDFSFDRNSPTKVIGKIICKASSNPYKDIYVSLSNNDCNWSTYTYTDEQGNYSFFDLTAGEYSLSVAAIKDEGSGEMELTYFSKDFTVFENKTSIKNLQIDCSLEIFDFRGKL